MTTRKKMFWMLLAVALFIAAVGGVKYFQIRSAMAQQGSFQPPPEAVTTTVVELEAWNEPVPAIGSVSAVNGVTVSADLPGIVRSIEFDSGMSVSRGAILVRLDTRQEQAQLKAAEAQLSLAQVDLRRAQELVGAGVIPQSTFDRAAAEFKQAQARVGEIRATIERKTIRAPFSGVLGIRQINLGQYLDGGAPIVSLQALQPVYVNFSVPQQYFSTLKPGTTLKVTSDGFEGTEVGRVTAFDSEVNESTRNVSVQAVFRNESERMRPGMFVEAAMSRSSGEKVITLPTSAINYAPFGDSVFIVEQVKGPDGKSYQGVRQQFVKLGGSRGDQIAVLTGLKPGEEVVTSGVFKLRPGAAVQVNNAVKPSNNPNPKPEDS